MTIVNILHSRMPNKPYVTLLTQIVEGIACLVERPRVELQADDGKDEDGEHDEEPDLHERSQGLDD